MAAITFIGSTLQINDSGAAFTITGVDADDHAGIQAAADTEVGGVISISELGETSEDVNFDLLKGGRKTHVNGVRDIGEISVTCEFDASDAGQNRIRALSNTNTTIDVAVTDQDNQVQCFQGVVANYRITERTASSYKGCMFAIRGQSALYYGT